MMKKNRSTKTERKSLAKGFLVAADKAVCTKSFTGRSGCPEEFAREVLQHVEVLLTNLAVDPAVREFLKASTKNLNKRSRKEVLDFTAYMEKAGAWAYRH
jgi:hypothetical protein